MRLLKYILCSLFFLQLTGALRAQGVEYGVALDTNYMLIGDQQHLTFKVKGDAGTRILFPQLKDTIVRGVEIISGPERDSVREADGRWLWEERYVVTAFDTGVYVIPPQPVTIEGSDFNNVLRTDPVAFVVNTYEVDPQKGNYDIVMPYAVPWTFAEILPYLLWVLLGVVLILAGWWLWRRRKKNQPLFAAKKEEIPPYVRAIRSLDEIRETKLWQPGREKEYYTRLTDTVRQYIDEELDIPAMEQTSAETLQLLKACPKVENGERDQLAEMLTTADYVKFARFTPLQDENARYLDSAYGFVRRIHDRVEAERQAEEEKEKKRREEEEKSRAEKEQRTGDGQ